MPSFGLLKEEILKNLEEQYTVDKTLFQGALNQMVKTFKKSPVLSELFQHYDSLLKSHFDETEYAKEYIQETVDYLRTLKIKPADVTLLNSLKRQKISEDKINPYVKALDTLVFGSKKNIKERLEAKQLLTQKLVTENKITSKVDPRMKGVFFEILQKKIKSRLNNLNEQELQAINAYAEKDHEKLLSSYIRLVDDNVSAIEEQLTMPQPAETKSRLAQAKNALLEMKAEEPTLHNLERLLVLKEGFNQ